MDFSPSELETGLRDEVIDPGKAGPLALLAQYCIRMPKESHKEKQKSKGSWQSSLLSQPQDRKMKRKG